MSKSKYHKTTTGKGKDNNKTPNTPKKAVPTKPVKTKVTTAKANYSFDPNSAVASEKTNHLVSFKCKINGVPRPQARCFAKTFGRNKPLMFSPSKANQQMFGKAFQSAMSKLNNHKLFTLSGEKAVTIVVKFYFPRPKSHYFYNTNKKQHELSPTAPLFVKKTPDLDNCIKLVIDALQGICYKNDSVVTRIEATKQFDTSQLVWKAGQSESTGCTLIKVTEIDDTTFDEKCSCISCQFKNK